MSISRSLAELAISTKSEDITGKALSAAKKLVLDTLGTTIAGHKEAGVSQILAQMRYWGGKKEATVLVHGGKLPCPEAAFTNSVMAHALDFDEVHVPASLHLLASLLPASLAAGEIAHSSGREVLDAIVMGEEVGARIGIEFSLCSSHVGFLPASVVGIFGTAAAVCRLLNFDVDETVNAFGLCYSQAAGSRQALFELTLAKRMQPAFVARAALLSVFLAKRGITAPEMVVEGDAGLFRNYTNRDAPAESVFTQKKGYFEIERVTVKRFPTCGESHAPILSAITLAKKNDLKVGDIDKVELYLGEGGNEFVGRPFSLGSDPQVSAQFSAPYAVALALVHRDVRLKYFRDDTIRKDVGTARLAQRIEIVPHWDFEASELEPERTMPDFPDWCYIPQVVRVTTCQGEIYTHSNNRVPVFGPNAMTWQDIERKFMDCAEFSEICPKRRAEEIVSFVRSFEKSDDVSDGLNVLLNLSKHRKIPIKDPS
jgi:2-methylcitrate dehydratase PrpD